MQQEKLETRRARCQYRRDLGEVNVVEEIQVLFEDFLTEAPLIPDVKSGSKEFFLLFKGVVIGAGYDVIDYGAWLTKQTKSVISPWYQEVMSQ